MTFFLVTTVVFLAVVVAIEGVALLALMRQVGTVLMHVSPPRPGTGFGGPVIGGSVSESVFSSVAFEAPAVFIFVGSNCPACAPIERVLRTFRDNYNELELFVVVTGEFEERRIEHAAELEVAAHHDLEGLAELWKIPGTPYAVGVSAEYRIAHAGVVNTLDQLEALAETTLVGVADIPDSGGDHRALEAPVLVDEERRIREEVEV